MSRPVVYFDENSLEITRLSLERAVKGCKYSYTVPEKATATITNGIRNLGLANAGEGHDNFLKGVLVSMDVTFTIKAWTEAERYSFMPITMSESTIHKITSLGAQDENYIEYVDKETIEHVNTLIEAYNKAKEENGAESDVTRQAYLRLLYNVPVGLKLTASVTTNYMSLKNIYRQRHNHILPEWHAFCDAMRQLPEHEWITGPDTQD